MWRDCGIVLLLASAIFMIACEQESYNEPRNLNITVPRWVKNGTKEQVILDCEYDYREDEEDIVIKWYLNNHPQAVYQWIPSENSRIFSDEFTSKVDWSYVLEGSDKFTKYRQIVLVEPTIEFRGTYECTVNSKFGYGVAKAKMDIYAPAENITLVYSRLPDDQVNVTCMIKHIFPKPDVQLFAVSKDSDIPKPIRETSLHIKDNGHHGFDITMNAIVSAFNLNSSSDTTFRCLVLIHESVYQEVREKVYHPTSEMAYLEPQYDNRSKGSSSAVSASLICIVFAILML